MFSRPAQDDLSGRLRPALLAAALAFAATAAPALGQSTPPAAISILVGFGPAQGNDQPARPEAASLAANRMSPDMSYDQTARFLARHLGRYLPGNPVVRARHAPGGAGLVAARRLAQSPPDGSAIALLSSNVIFGAALGLPGAERAIERLVWLGGVSADAWGCIRASAAADRPVIWAGSLGAGSRADVHARALRDLLGAGLRITSGYASRFELVRALETGEIDVACGWPVSDLKRRHGAWIATGKMEILAMFSQTSRGLPAGASPPSAEIGDALSALAIEAELAWPLAGPPGLPPPIADAFAQALEKLAYDQVAIKEAAAAGVVLDPVPAQRVRDLAHRLQTLPEGARARLTRLFTGAPGGQ